MSKNDDLVRWVEWLGGPCPIIEPMPGEVRVEDGEVVQTRNLQGFNWSHGPDGPVDGRKIIAYRLTPSPIPQPPAVEAEAVERLRPFSESAAKGIDILGEVVEAYGSADNHPQWQRIVVRQMAEDIHSVLAALSTVRASQTSLLKAKTDEIEELKNDLATASGLAIDHRDRANRAEAEIERLREEIKELEDVLSDYRLML